MKYGLNEKQLDEIGNILRTYFEIEEAVLFGSRAIDTYKEASDVDIALKGERVTTSLAAKLKYHLEEDTYLPFFFDFIAYPAITNEALKEHIDTRGVLIFRAGWRRCKLEELISENDSEQIDQRFIFYFMQSIKPELNIMTDMNSIKRLLTKKLSKDLTIFLPSLPEQRAIASILSNFDDKIDLLRRQNKTLKAMTDIPLIEVTKPFNDKSILNGFQISTLEKLRNNLLPKLVNGEVRVKI